MVLINSASEQIPEGVLVVIKSWFESAHSATVLWRRWGNCGNRATALTKSERSLLGPEPDYSISRSRRLFDNTF